MPGKAHDSAASSSRSRPYFGLLAATPRFGRKKKRRTVGIEATARKSAYSSGGPFPALTATRTVYTASQQIDPARGTSTDPDCLPDQLPEVA